MATLTLDTHDFVKGLTQAGIPERQAEAIAQGMRRLNLDDVATKCDLQELREELRVEIRDVKIDILKWMIPLMLGQIVAFAAIVQWLVE